MEILKIAPGETADLGRRGEDMAKQIAFHIGPWQQYYGIGVVQLLVKRCGDTTPYPAVVEVQGEYACWTVTAGDTAVAGRGSYELRYYSGCTLAKSATGLTLVDRAYQALTEEAPEPQKDWVDKVLEAGMNAESASKNATDALGYARCASANAQNSEQLAKQHLEKTRELVAIQSDMNENNPESYAYVKNRTHYTEGIRTEILAQTEWADGDGWAVDLERNLGLKLGETYAVWWNGKEYLCETKRIVFENTATLYLGNDGWWDLADSGEPFVINDEPDADWSYVCAWDDSTEGSVKIEHYAVTIHQLDAKYIPTSWLARRQAAETEVLAETTLSFEGYSKQVEGVDKDKIQNGEVYTVYWKGEKYQSYAIVDESEYDGTAYIIGNAKLMENLGLSTTWPDTGEPFLLLSFVGTAHNFFVIKDANDAEEVTLQVTGQEYTYNTLPEGHLPESVPKVYKAQVGQVLAVTAVDDDGVPTAWETVDLPEGGGGVTQTVQADLNQNDPEQPDYVKNRTHWVDGGYALEEITVEANADTDGMMIIPDFVPLEDGKTYTVTYNGVEYECTPLLVEEDGMYAYYLGNIAAMQGTGDTGEPFVMIVAGNEDSMATINGYGGMFIDITGATSATISIGNETVHKLDNKFLDLDWLPTREDTYTDLLPETSYAYESQIYYLDKAEVPLLLEDGEELEDINGQEYSVFWNGVEYKVAGKYEDGSATGDLSLVFLGNKSLWSTSFEDTGEPFLYMWNDVTNVQPLVKSTDTAETVTVRIAKRITAYNTMPEEYLPESVDGIILRSSTADSTKKFRITVDDSGALTVTEVTE